MSVPQGQVAVVQGILLLLVSWETNSRARLDVAQVIKSKQVVYFISSSEFPLSFPFFAHL